MDILVREQLIQRHFVLLYLPGYMLVMSSEFALERARHDGSKMVISDAKIGTVEGLKWKWSSIRGKCHRTQKTQPYAVWISPVENKQTICLGAKTLREAVRCEDHNCDHHFIIEYGFDGHDDGFRSKRCCCATNNWAPAVVIDKHIPFVTRLIPQTYTAD